MLFVLSRLKLLEHDAQHVVMFDVWGLSSRSFLKRVLVEGLCQFCRVGLLRAQGDRLLALSGGQGFFDGIQVVVGFGSDSWGAIANSRMEKGESDDLIAGDPQALCVKPPEVVQRTRVTRNGGLTEPGGRLLVITGMRGCDATMETRLGDALVNRGTRLTANFGVYNGGRSAAGQDGRRIQHASQ